MVSAMGERVPYSPITERPRIVWPGEARVALWVCPNVLFFEYAPAVSKYPDTFNPRGAPDIRFYGHQDYGNRVGFWRTLRMLDELQTKCTALISTGILEHFPELREAMVERDWEIMIHSMYNTRYLWGMSQSEEREYYQLVIAEVESHTNQTPKGIMSPGPSTMTNNTPDLMAEAGFIYNGDFKADDQPF